MLLRERRIYILYIHKAKSADRVVASKKRRTNETKKKSGGAIAYKGN